MTIAPVVAAALNKLPIPSGVKSVLVHPAGPMTIFFWAPTFKWAITLSNVQDMKRPAENISVNQQMAIFTTGVLWCRYSTQITPVNYNLLVVNFFMACTAGYQLCRKSQVPADKGGFLGHKHVAAAPKVTDFRVDAPKASPISP